MIQWVINLKDDVEYVCVYKCITMIYFQYAKSKKS